MANLKHPALRLFEFPMPECISAMLHKMPCLETLQLSHPSATHMCYGDYDDALLVVPASVQRVELINVYSESLVLDSDSTAVRLMGAVCCLQETIVKWKDVRSQLKGLRLYQRGDEVPNYEVHPLGKSHLWDCVEVLQYTRAPVSPINVNLHELPCASLGSLTSLHVGMVNLCITIPALPGLKDLRLDCSQTLCMSFEDARVSAKNLLGFELVFTTMCACDTLPTFWAALTEAGKEFTLQRYSKVRKQVRCYPGVLIEERGHHCYRMQSGTYGVGASCDPWEGLFTACGCEGCLAGLGLGMKWTSRGQMVGSRTDYSE